MDCITFCLSGIDPPETAALALPNHHRLREWEVKQQVEGSPDLSPSAPDGSLLSQFKTPSMVASAALWLLLDVCAGLLLPPATVVEELEKSESLLMDSRPALGAVGETLLGKGTPLAESSAANGLLDLTPKPVVREETVHLTVPSSPLEESSQVAAKPIYQSKYKIIDPKKEPLLSPDHICPDTPLGKRAITSSSVPKSSTCQPLEGGTSAFRNRIGGVYQPKNICKMFSKLYPGMSYVLVFAPASPTGLDRRPFYSLPKDSYTCEHMVELESFERGFRAELRTLYNSLETSAPHIAQALCDSYKKYRNLTLQLTLT